MAFCGEATASAAAATTAWNGLKKSKGKPEPNDAHSRRFCSSSGSFMGPVFVSRTTNYPLTAGMKYIDVQLLTGQHLYVAVDVRCKVGDIFDCVCSHIGAQNSLLFALCMRVENEYRFLLADQKLAKCTQKNWAKSGGWGTDMHGQPSVILYLRVHTYVDAVRMICCPVSLLHYYMQLRENVRHCWQEQLVREERCYEVAAMALQADFGDYSDALQDSASYFCPDLYFPSWVVANRGTAFLTQHTPSVHQDLKGTEAQEARYQFCDAVSSGVWAVNEHLYRLQSSKGDPQSSVLLAIAPSGLHVYRRHLDNPRFPVASSQWNRIAKLSFDRKKFLLVCCDGQKSTFYASSDQKSRYLLQFCKTFHQNLIILHAQGGLQGGGDQRPLISSAVACNEAKTAIPNTAQVGQRVSLVSDASSNTTSGVVSDKPRGAQEDSENEVDLELDAGANSKAPLVHSDSARSDASYASKGPSTSSRGDTPSPVCETQQQQQKVTATQDMGRGKKPTTTIQCSQQQQQLPILNSALATLEEKLRTCHLAKNPAARDLLAGNRLSTAADIRLRSLWNQVDNAGQWSNYYHQQGSSLVNPFGVSSATNLETLYNDNNAVGARYSLALPSQTSDHYYNHHHQTTANTAINTGSPVFGRTQPPLPGPTQQPPNYEQAVLQSAVERQQGKRWTTITCIEPSILNQMYSNLDGQLHQAQSEPGLGMGPVGMCMPPSARGVHRNAELINCTGRSKSSYILDSSPSSLEECYYTPAANYCQQINSSNGNVNSCSCEFVAHGQSRTAALAKAAYLHQHHQTAAVQHGAHVSRTQSLQESRYQGRAVNGAASAEADLYAALAMGLANHRSTSSEMVPCRPNSVRHRLAGYCEACQEEHDHVGTLDLDRVTSLLQGKTDDLPLIRALCSEHALHTNNGNAGYCGVSELDQQIRHANVNRVNDVVHLLL